jgi:hypothetical protein
VEQIFFTQQKSVEAVARKIANFFEKLLEMQRKKGTVDDRVLEELPYAILKTSDLDWLKDILPFSFYSLFFFQRLGFVLFCFVLFSFLFFFFLSFFPQIFLKLSTKERMHELRDFWKPLGTSEEMSEEYCEMVLAADSDDPRPPNDVLTLLYDRVAELAIEVGSFQYAIFISEK